MCYFSSRIESSFQLNNHTDPLNNKQRRQFFQLNIAQLTPTSKAWMKWLSFQFVVSSVYMQLITHNSAMPSRPPRPMCRNYCLCVHVSVCVCMSLPNSWAKNDYDQITKKIFKKNLDICFFYFLLTALLQFFSKMWIYHFWGYKKHCDRWLHVHPQTW